MIGARVIGTGAGTASLMIQLDRGERDGIRKNMGVITPDGVVGKVVESYPNASQVLLLTGHRRVASEQCWPIRESRAPLAGRVNPLLVMKYVPTTMRSIQGNAWFTSGMDRIFPRDLPVGTVAEIKPGNPFKQIRVKPAASLERLEEVLVLLTLILSR